MVTYTSYVGFGRLGFGEGGFGDDINVLEPDGIALASNLGIAVATGAAATAVTGNELTTGLGLVVATADLTTPVTGFLLSIGLTSVYLRTWQKAVPTDYTDVPGSGSGIWAPINGNSTTYLPITGDNAASWVEISGPEKTWTPIDGDDIYH